MYLVHIPVKWVLLALSGVSVKGGAGVSPGLLALASLGAASLLVILVDRPVEAFRRRRYFATNGAFLVLLAQTWLRTRLSTPLAPAAPPGASSAGS